MSRLRNVIDFSELTSAVAGEGLEALVRALTERMGLRPEWSGRGADGGRDLLLTQCVRTPLQLEVRWLVSCKDLADSNSSVGENDLPSNIVLKVQQHDAQGFLLVTTTTISTAAKALLDAARRSHPGLFTDVWDGSTLAGHLLRPANEDLLRQFIPASYARVRLMEGGHDDPVEQIEERFARYTKSRSRERLILGIPAPLPRAEVGHVEDLLAEGRPVVLSGESGTGKSGIGNALCVLRGSQEVPVLLIDAQQRGNARDLRGISDNIGLSGLVTSGIRRLAERVGCRVIIDQLDSATADGMGQLFVELALECAQMEGVQVVVLSRRRESYEGESLDQLVAGGFVELACGPLSEADAREALGRVGIGEPTDDLLTLSRNLLNLSIVARIKSEQPDYQFDAALDETALWGAYVHALRDTEKRSPGGLAFGDRVLAEARHLAAEGLRAEDRTFLLEAQRTPEQRRLESWQVIVQESGSRYRFYHENLQDFLYAQHAVDRELMPEGVIRDIGEHRTRAIFPWMQRIYPPHSTRRLEFMRRAFNA